MHAYLAIVSEFGMVVMLTLAWKPGGTLAQYHLLSFIRLGHILNVNG